MAALPWRSLSNPVIANARARPMTSRGYGEWPQANKRTMALSVCWLVAVARPTAQQSLTVPAGTVTVSAYFEAQRTQESWQKTSRTTLESLFGTTLGVLRTAMHEEIANRFKAEVDMLKGRCKAVGLVLGLVEPMKAIEDQPIVVENKTASSPKTPLSAADLAAHGNPTGTEHEDGKKAEDAKEEKEAEAEDAKKDGTELADTPATPAPNEKKATSSPSSTEKLLGPLTPAKRPASAATDALPPNKRAAKMLQRYLAECESGLERGIAPPTRSFRNLITIVISGWQQKGSLRF